MSRFTSRGQVPAARVAPAINLLDMTMAPAFFPRRFTPAALRFIAGAILGIAAGAPLLPRRQARRLGSRRTVRRCGSCRAPSSSTARRARCRRAAPHGSRLEDLLEEPGDSGVPPSFDWTGSKNLKQAEVLYPAPHRFADANGTAIGYDDEVVFPVKLTPEREGEPIELKLAFAYRPVQGSLHPERREPRPRAFAGDRQGRCGC